MDKTGCEDPDLDTDTTTNTLHKLEQELRLLTNGTDTNTQCIYKSCMQTHQHGVASYEQHVILFLMFKFLHDNDDHKG